MITWVLYTILYAFFNAFYEGARKKAVGKNTIYDLLHKGILKSIKVSRKYLIPKEFIIEFVNTYR